MKTINNFKLKLSLVIFCGMFFSLAVYSQNITNTLGVSGSFKIKDGAATFFTLTQSNGYLELNKSLKLTVTTDLNTGVIYKGANRFIHDYKNPGNTGKNTFVGINAGNFTLGGGGQTLFGSYNTSLGYSTLSALTTGYYNTAVGNESMALNTTGYSNVALGYACLYSNISGNNNIAIGEESLFNNATGHSNIALGHWVLLNNNTGFSNIAMGNNSMETNTTGSYNVGMGDLTLSGNTNGSYNTAIGIFALSGNTSNYNTAIGYNAGTNLQTGSNTTLIGYNSQPSIISAMNQVVLGNNQISSLRCNVQTITSLSDIRDKKNIIELSLGLNFLMKIKPRQFNWDKREWYDDNKSDGSKIQETPTAGFIAQELDEVQTSENAGWLNLVLKDNPEKWEATYGNLLPVMVKAIQELKEENDKLKKEIDNIKNIVEKRTKIDMGELNAKQNKNTAEK